MGWEVRSPTGCCTLPSYRRALKRKRYTGTLTIDAGDSFTAAKLTQISGGTFVLGGNLDLTTAGISLNS